MTSTTATVPAQPTEPCALHGKRHRSGSAAALACQAASAPQAPPPAEVTAAHVLDALATWAGRISYLTVGADLTIFAGAWSVGEVLVDRADLLSMLDVYGSPSAVADVLTADLHWEQEHGSTVETTR